MEEKPNEKDYLVLLNVYEGKLTMKVLDETVEYKVFESVFYPVGAHDCYTIDVMDKLADEVKEKKFSRDKLEELIAWARDSFEE